MTSVIPALTFHQPYASFVAGGWKTIETRSWSTGYRGWLAIHAGATIPSYLGLGRRGRIGIGDYTIEKTGPRELWLTGGGLYQPYLMPLGGIVAVAKLLDCVPMVHRDEHVEAPPCLNIGPSGLTLWTGNAWYTDETQIDVTNQQPYGHFAPGRTAWVLGHVKRFPRVTPCDGHQQLWDVSRAGVEVADQVERFIEQAEAAA